MLKHNTVNSDRLPHGGAVWAQIINRRISILVIRVNTAITAKKINISVKNNNLYIRKGYEFIMTYEFRKMPLQKVPYEVETIVVKAVIGYLKELNNTSSLKGIPDGMDYYDEPTCDLFQLGCHIGGRGKK